MDTYSVTVNILNFSDIGLFAVSVENMFNCHFSSVFPVARTHFLLMRILTSLEIQFEEAVQECHCRGFSFIGAWL